jgi:hypothetical protein
VHQNLRDMVADQVHRFGRAIGATLVDQNVAQRHEDRYARRRTGNQQRNQLVAKRAPPERIELDHHRVRLQRLERRHQLPAPCRAPRIVDRTALLVDNAGETRIGGACRRELHQIDGAEVEFRYGHAAGYDRHGETVGGKRVGKRRRAAQMADAEQMLYPEQKARRTHAIRSVPPSSGRLKRSGQIVPSRSTRKRWRAGKRNRSGSRACIVQPVASE